MLSLTVGTHTLVLSVMDSGGNVATDELVIMVDAAPVEEPVDGEAGADEATLDDAA